MRFERFADRYVVRLDKGEEIIETLKRFCQERGIKLGTVMGIGATNKATIGLFETEGKQYYSRELTGDHEIAPLFGLITTMKGETYLHVHANLCDSENKSLGGHLNSAVVSATFEAVIQVMDGEVDREFSDEIGLNLLKF
jgi:predicted DNA-binding protein with PD1-like motif